MSWDAGAIKARARVVSDNDYAGDPDGLVQLAHHLLSPSVEVRAVVGSFQNLAYLQVDGAQDVDSSVAAASAVAELAGRSDVPIVAGATAPLVDRSTPQPSPGADAIVAEAARESDLRLFVCCGGSLTNMASALLLDPGIAERLTPGWIGGSDVEPPEYNQSIDPIAAEVVLGSDLPLWQVPREAYKQVLASHAELEQRLVGPLGRHLFDALGEISLMWDLGETFVLGDNPLVLLTALLSSFERETSSCEWDEHDGRRVYTRLDSRLVLEDLYAKLARHAA